MLLANEEIELLKTPGIGNTYNPEFKKIASIFSFLALPYELSSDGKLELSSWDFNKDIFELYTNVQNIYDSIAVDKFKIESIRHGHRIKSIRHCYTPDGEGFFGIEYVDGERRFVKSEYQLQLTGACWSASVCRKLFLAQVGLDIYLSELKEKLQKRPIRPVVEMDIKPLYGMWLHQWRNTMLRTMEECWNLGDTQRNVLLSNCDEIESRLKDVQSGNITWYNGEENTAFYAVRDALRSAVDQMYARRKELEATGLWPYAKDQIDVLYDVVYGRRESLKCKHQCT